MVYTDSGVTLFETKARAVTFEPTIVYGAATTGNSVMVDGVPVADRALSWRSSLAGCKVLLNCATKSR